MIENLISIVVPVYNAQRYIGEMIETVLHQTYTNWEMILVDDGSTDNSCAEIARYHDPRIRLICLGTNHGAAFARNTGIKRAEGRFLVFQDADDLWDINKLQSQLAFMLQKDCAFSFTSYEFMSEDGKRLGKVANVPPAVTYREALKNTTISTITVMFDREKIPEQLLMMPEIESEDTATWWQILRAGYTAYGLDQILSFYRRSKGTLSANKWVAVQRIWKLYKREGLSLIYRIYCFLCYARNAVRRRI